MVDQISVSASRYIPSQLDTCVPGSKELSRHFTGEIPKHCSIAVTTVETSSSDDLVWIGKAEGLPDITGVSDELGPFDSNVVVHVTHLVKFMAKMSSSLNPRQVSAIQLKSCWISDISHGSTHEKAL